MANRPPRLDRVFQKYDSPVYFVTFNTRGRASILANDAVHARFVEFAREGQTRDVSVGRYVIMPDHIHLFVQGGREFVLPVWVKALKRCLSSVIETESLHWQEGFFDHLLRHEESYAEKWEYVRGNPERAGFVVAGGEWPYQGEIALIDRL